MKLEHGITFLSLLEISERFFVCEILEIPNSIINEIQN